MTDKVNQKPSQSQHEAMALVFGLVLAFTLFYSVIRRIENKLQYMIYELLR